MMSLWRCVAVYGVVMCISTTAAIAVDHHESTIPSPVASTHCGPVQGTWEKGAAVFRGIPYGLPPVAERRWRPSEMPEKDDGCWKGTWPASQFGNVCMQMSQPDGKVPLGSEDCLFINVITYGMQNSSGPGASRELLPVALWLHGGYLMFGSGGEPAGYAPNPTFAKNTGVVAVSINYRLNVFGFLALDLLNEGNGSGNYGFYDQILALKWIQRNIEGFGGDKNKVTVFGQSSGGTSIVALLASPLGKGLFHGVVAMSASTTINATLEDADKANQIFLKKSGCERAACFRGLPADELLAITPFDVYPCWNGNDSLQLPTYGVFVGPVTVIDGVLIPKPSLTVIAEGLGNDVATVIGTTGQEVDIEQPNSARGETWAEYAKDISDHLGTFAADPGLNNTYVVRDVNVLYPRNFSSPSSGGTCVAGTTEYLMTSLVSDIRTTCPSILLAQHYAQYFKSVVYSYVAVQCPSNTAREYGARYAYHMWDSDVLFNLSFTDKPDFHPQPQDWEFVTMMQTWFGHFTRGEAPHPEWKTADQGTFTLMREPEMLEATYHKEQCDYFNSHGFPPYRWQN